MQRNSNTNGIYRQAICTGRGAPSRAFRGPAVSAWLLLTSFSAESMIHFFDQQLEDGRDGLRHRGQGRHHPERFRSPSAVATRSSVPRRSPGRHSARSPHPIQHEPAVRRRVRSGPSTGTLGDGLDAHISLGGSLVAVRDHARHAIVLASRYTARLGATDALEHIERHLIEGNGAVRQRRAFARGGMRSVLEQLPVRRRRRRSSRTTSSRPGSNLNGSAKTTSAPISSFGCQDGSTGPSLGFLGHLDVVPVRREGWSVEPFAAVERDGAIWGHGSIDMKPTRRGAAQVRARRTRRGRVPSRRALLDSRALGGEMHIQLPSIDQPVVSEAVRPPWDWVVRCTNAGNAAA